ncbi:hypothetical protein [Acaryochloris marina]|uniref:DUF304 domain-containing protein n=1 Tax=Acaryochloris marina (strain MBIC 11017) TaxID=329726 RepID=B0BZ75_ACAM1|nr:hypothetical protein [Acaryochloris marina]ABW29519.1 hypothetical protein AM1_4543 [Acaryochloris marina MBIC11017]BDM78427.1 hypothetical protein AM10699_12960 [Acaryochloris marina MBIC10699]
MKVIEHTPALLVLQERLLGIRLFGGATALLGFMIFIIFEFPFDLFGCFCIAIAALISTLSPLEICTFDKSDNVVVLEKRRWFSSQIRRYCMTQIETIHVEEKAWLGTNFYQVRLNFVSGHRSTLTQFATTDRIAQHSLAERIRDFLEVGCLTTIS